MINEEKLKSILYFIMEKLQDLNPGLNTLNYVDRTESIFLKCEHQYRIEEDFENGLVVGRCRKCGEPPKTTGDQK